MALATGAHGVHLRGDSMPAARARSLAPIGFLIGRSVHSVDEAVRVSAEGGVDYLLFGAVFATASKPGQPPAGVRSSPMSPRRRPLPVLAVGGVTADTVTQLAGTGAAGFAAIGWFADGGEACRSRCTCVREGMTMESGFATPLLELFKRGDVAPDVKMMAAQGALAPRALEQLGLLALLVRDSRSRDRGHRGKDAAGHAARRRRRSSCAA